MDKNQQLKSFTEDLKIISTDPSSEIHIELEATLTSMAKLSEDLIPQMSFNIEAMTIS